MSPTLTRPPASPARARPSGSLLPGVAVLVAVYIVIFLTLRMPQVVPRLTIVNPHDWFANVEVTSGGANHWTALLGVDRQGTRQLEEVYDQGSTWRFRFSYANVDGGEMTISRHDLAAANWTIRVPDQFAQRMKEAHLPASSQLVVDGTTPPGSSTAAPSSTTTAPNS